jgi:molybdate/tungstate transport system substrate-binding protein
LADNTFHGLHSKTQTFLPSRAILFLVLGSIFISGCTKNPEVLPSKLTGELIVFHAGSLTLPIERLSAAFQEVHPAVEILTEAAGSRTTARKISELQREADLVISADYQVINTLLIPDFAAWNILFARNAMVVTYNDQAIYADEINSDNWYKILTRDGVVVGRSNPQADPNGYRTLMVWQLAEIHYDQAGLYELLQLTSPPKNIRPKEVDLIPLLQSGDMDYAYNYQSVAIQHDLKYVDLPSEINLSNPEFTDIYQRAVVALDGQSPGDVIHRQGEPIIYGVTIPHTAPNPDLAVAFLIFLLSPEGMEILSNHGQIPINPPLTSEPDLLPEDLRPWVQSQN